MVLFYHILNSQNHESSDGTAHHNYKDINVYILFLNASLKDETDRQEREISHLCYNRLILLNQNMFYYAWFDDL